MKGEEDRRGKQCRCTKHLKASKGWKLWVLCTLVTPTVLGLSGFGGLNADDVCGGVSECEFDESTRLVSQRRRWPFVGVEDEISVT